MGDGKRVLYEVDGKVVADVRSAEELAQRITLFPGWAVVEKVQLSEKSRGGIIMPNPDTKDQQHLMLWKVAVAGPQKKDSQGNLMEMRANVGQIVVLKPSVSQFLVAQRHQFGVINDSDIIGTVQFDEAPAEHVVDDEAKELENAAAAAMTKSDMLREVFDAKTPSDDAELKAGFKEALEKDD